MKYLKQTNLFIKKYFLFQLKISDNRYQIFALNLFIISKLYSLIIL